MKKVLLILISPLFFSGCSTTLVKKPAANNMKKIAFISVYSNSSIYELKNTKKTDSLAILSKMMNGNDNLDDGNVQISTYALKHYAENFSNSHWEIVPPSKTVKHEAYKKFVTETKGDGAMGFINKMASSQWAVPPGMTYFPYEAIAHKPGAIRYTDDSKKKTKQRLAKLSKELGVDGVGIVYVDLAYKKPFMSLSGSGLLAMVRTSAIPQVTSEMIIVNSKGEIALQTPPVKRGAGKRYEAGKAPMLRGGRVDLSGDEGQETINSFSEAIKNNVKAVKSKVKKEMSKG